MELTPEERERIYREEQASKEIRKQMGAHKAYSLKLPEDIPPAERDQMVRNRCIGVVVFVSLAMVAFGAGSSSSSTDSSAPAPVSAPSATPLDTTSQTSPSTPVVVSTELPADIGDIGILYNGSASIRVADSQADFDKYLSAIAARDNVGEQNLMDAGTVYLVPSKTNAKWLGSSGLGVADIRIVGGDHDGQEAFTDIENLHRQN